MPRVWITDEAGGGHWEYTDDPAVIRQAMVVDDPVNNTVSVRPTPAPTTVIDNSPQARLSRMAAMRERRNAIAIQSDTRFQSKSGRGSLGNIKTQPSIMEPDPKFWQLGTYPPPPKVPPNPGTSGAAGKLQEMGRAATVRFGSSVASGATLLAGFSYLVGQGGVPPWNAPGGIGGPTRYGTPPSGGASGGDGGIVHYPSDFGEDSDDVETWDSIFRDEMTGRRRATVFTRQNIRAAKLFEQFGEGAMALITNISQRRRYVAGMLASQAAQIINIPDIEYIVPRQPMSRRNGGNRGGFRPRRNYGQNYARRTNYRRRAPYRR